MAEANLDQSLSDSYAALHAGYGELLAEVKDLSGLLAQLAALFNALKKDGVAANELLDLGEDLAVDWANGADVVRERAAELLGQLPPVHVPDPGSLTAVVAGMRPSR